MLLWDSYYNVRRLAPHLRCFGPTDPDRRQRRERQIVES